MPIRERKTRTARGEGWARAPRPRRPELRTLWGLDLGIRVRRDARFEGDGAPPANLRSSTLGRPHLRRTSFHPSCSSEKENLGHDTSVQTRRVVGHTDVGHQVYRWATHFNPVIVPSASSETMTGPSVSKTNSGKEIEGHAFSIDQRFLKAPWEIEVRCILPSSTARQMLLQEAEDGHVFLRSIDLDQRSRDISAGLLGNRHALVNVGKAMWTSA